MQRSGDTGFRESGNCLVIFLEESLTAGLLAGNLNQKFNLTIEA
jgi:hypothetical protein